MQKELQNLLHLLVVQKEEKQEEELDLREVLETIFHYARDVDVIEVLEIELEELVEILEENLKVMQTHFKHYVLVQVAMDRYEVVYVASVSLQIDKEDDVVEIG